MGLKWSRNCDMVASVFSVHIFDWVGFWSFYDWRNVHRAYDREQRKMIINFYLD